jgi:probable F420-dependent oxidoreductase
MMIASEASVSQAERRKVRRMRIGISCYDQSVDDLVTLGSAAEEFGFDSLWLGEHVLAPMAYDSTHPTQPGDADHQGSSNHNGKPIVDPSVHLTDPLIALSAVAARTRTVRLATGIYLLPLRHPLLVARAVATLAEVSDSRFALGVGAGWLREEFAALGVPFAGRTGRLEEQLAVVRSALRGGPFDFHGDHYDIDTVQVCAAPVRVPLVLGGNTDVALRRAVRLGDGWFSSGIPSFEQALRLRDRIDQLGQEAGRTEPFETTYRIAAPDPELVDRYAAEGLDNLLVMKYDVWVGDDLDSRRASLAAAAERLGLRAVTAANGAHA